MMIEALILGAIGGVIPGPVLVTTFTEILQSGFLKCLRIIILGMITETTVALVSLVALTSFDLSKSFFRGLSIIGGGVLVWIAISIWKVKSIDTGEKVHFSFGKISAMIFANGALWTFWIAVCVPRAILLGQQIFLGQYIFLALVEIGWLVATVLIAVVFSRFRKLLSNPKVVPIMFKTFSLTFVYLAGNMLYQSILFFTHPNF